VSAYFANSFDPTSEGLGEDELVDEAVSCSLGSMPWIIALTKALDKTSARMAVRRQIGDQRGCHPG
jgi:hypothetical protein